MLIEFVAFVVRGTKMIVDKSEVSAVLKIIKNRVPLLPVGKPEKNHKLHTATSDAEKGAYFPIFVEID